MTEGFSVRGRAANLVRMGTETFDLLVVGGGIVGAGVARDAASRGLRTALVERDDFASGTSGKTSRLVHGGLRYLRHYKVGLVRQAVRERDLLLDRAPALVHPLPFLIPTYGDRGPGPVLLRFGLFVYDFLSRRKALPRRVWLRPAEVLEREPRLSPTRLRGGGVYSDAWTDDARLVLAVVQDAARAGAVVANHAEVETLTRSEGRVDGAWITNRLEGNRIRVGAHAMVNATGVWLDRLRTPRAMPTIRPTKGIHIFLPREKVGNRHALALTARSDGRVVFVLPWGDLALIGTTDTDFRGDPDRVLPDASDVGYLLRAVNEAFPEAHVQTEDVVSAYAGLRPLVRQGRREPSESDVSREHAIFEDGDGLISVAGGKLTTHRAMAEDVVRLVASRLGRSPPPRTAERSLGPAVQPLDAFTSLGLDEPAALRLQGRVGPEELARYLASPRARERIVAGIAPIWTEVDIAVEAEMALTLSDVLVRRLGLFYEAPDQGLEAAPEVADRIGGLLGWDGPRVRREVEGYRAIVAAHREFRMDHGR